MITKATRISEDKTALIKMIDIPKETEIFDSSKKKWKH
jgi:hypothetical protein